MTDKVVVATTGLVDVETKGSTTYGEEAITEASTNAAKIEMYLLLPQMQLE